ncbi:hypothetical protein F5Y13DRAFT_121774 [Hypoxylon sp. FL1857]|nr:hypothetical protein F5Y13DRAFT_121774 [Hypoxylon sp. FL1857]
MPDRSAWPQLRIPAWRKFERERQAGYCDPHHIPCLPRCVITAHCHRSLGTHPPSVFLPRGAPFETEQTECEALVCLVCVCVCDFFFRSCVERIRRSSPSRSRGEEREPGKSVHNGVMGPWQIKTPIYLRYRLPREGPIRQASISTGAFSLRVRLQR